MYARAAKISQAHNVRKRIEKGEEGLELTAEQKTLLASVDASEARNQRRNSVSAMATTQCVNVVIRLLAQ